MFSQVCVILSTGGVVPSHTNPSLDHTPQDHTPRLCPLRLYLLPPYPPGTIAPKHKSRHYTSYTGMLSC